jgi:hypothetical protein
MQPDKSYPSPDGRYRLDIYAHEVRMSHWIDCPYLYNNDTGDFLFSAGKLWNATKVDWSNDSNALKLELHHNGCNSAIEVVLDLAKDEGKIYAGTTGVLSRGSLSSVAGELANTTEFRLLFY